MVYLIKFQVMFKSRTPEYVPREHYVSKRIDRLTLTREKSPVEKFYIQRHKDKFTGHDSVAIVDDIYMLFNQQRLDRMSSAALSQWLDQTSRYDSTLQNLRSRMTDAQLGSFIKSRYIQSRSELLAWSGYLESMYPEIIPSGDPSLSGDPSPSGDSSPSGDLSSGQ